MNLEVERPRRYFKDKMIKIIQLNKICFFLFEDCWIIMDVLMQTFYVFLVTNEIDSFAHSGRGYSTLPQKHYPWSTVIPHQELSLARLCCIISISHDRLGQRANQIPYWDRSQNRRLHTENDIDSSDTRHKPQKQAALKRSYNWFKYHFYHLCRKQIQLCWVCVITVTRFEIKVNERISGRNKA